jgi:hypothetical protein
MVLIGGGSTDYLIRGSDATARQADCSWMTLNRQDRHAVDAALKA